MKLLLIGGTRFLGRAIVEAALMAGDEVTLFNRGQSNPDLFAGAVELIAGDRNSDLDRLAGRQWDGVIDTCGYVPRQIRAATAQLKDAVPVYTFVSSISVYQEPPAPSGLDENSPLATIADETVEEVTGETYGALKALCERAAADGMDGRAIQVRSGLIVGPHDLSDRFTYWPVRVARGGTVLAPGRPDQPVQFIDVRDIAAWTLEATRQQLSGAFNVTGPAYTLHMESLLQACRDATGSDARFVWVDEAFLEENEVRPYVDMPLWLPLEYSGMDRSSIRKALDTGLKCRPLTETIHDTLAFAADRPDDHKWRAGISAAREAELLAAWA